MKIRRRPPNPKVQVANLEYAIPHEDSRARNILEEIIWAKDREVEIARQRVSLETLKEKISSLPSTKDFKKSLEDCNVKPAVIAEVKKASPSRGVIREKFKPSLIAKEYLEGGASCISVLTDKKFFQGGFEVLVEVRAAVDLPILCKDFILSPYQIYQARAAGADAILLIAGILSDQDLIYLRKIAANLSLAVLVEVHDSKELKRVLSIGGFSLIGINNRDLTSFETDLRNTEVLCKAFSKEIDDQNILIVSESGLFDRKDLDRVVYSGGKAVLVGESLMRQENITKGLKLLIGG